MQQRVFKDRHRYNSLSIDTLPDGEAMFSVHNPDNVVEEVCSVILNRGQCAELAAALLHFVATGNIEEPIKL